jgi:glycerophosphoryl diester phosphodiesterase
LPGIHKQTSIDTMASGRLIPFDLQGHRGARGLKPENTLPGFETALDLGVASIETDVHLTKDKVPILFHDDRVSSKICRGISENDVQVLEQEPFVSSLTLAQMRGFRADQNPDPSRFPHQNNQTTPLATWFAEHWGMDPWTPPTLSEFFSFATAYAGDPGKIAGKTDKQRRGAANTRFDLELKRVPFRPETIGDHFDGRTPGDLEQRVLDIIQEAGMADRTCVRSFDHRCIRMMEKLDSGIARAVLIAGTAPISPVDWARNAGATTYCPEAEFLDELQVRQCHDAGIRVLPWTVNEPADWQTLLDWGIDGITTDFPDRLAEFLMARGIPF